MEDAEISNQQKLKPQFLYKSRNQTKKLAKLVPSSEGAWCYGLAAGSFVPEKIAASTDLNSHEGQKCCVRQDSGGTQNLREV